MHLCNNKWDSWFEHSDVILQIIDHLFYFYFDYYLTNHSWFIPTLLLHLYSDYIFAHVRALYDIHYLGSMNPFYNKKNISK